MSVEAVAGRVWQDSRVQVAVVAASGARLADRLREALGETPSLEALVEVERAAADVVVVVSELVTEALLDELEIAARRAHNARQRVVLVAGPLRERYLPRLFGAGVVSVLPHRDVTPAQVLHAVLACAAGRSVIPDSLVRWLVDEVQSAHCEPLLAQDTPVGGLTAREVEVLRRLADGHDTARIASELSYSERTIKKIIQDVMSRLRLRNRAHAVSYAMRVGAI